MAKLTLASFSLATDIFTDSRAAFRETEGISSYDLHSAGIFLSSAVAYLRHLPASDSTSVLYPTLEMWRCSYLVSNKEEGLQYVRKVYQLSMPVLTVRRACLLRPKLSQNQNIVPCLFRSAQHHIEGRYSGCGTTNNDERLPPQRKVCRRQ